MSRVPALGPRGEGWVAIQVVLFVLIAAAGVAGPALTGAPRAVLAVAGGVLLAAGLYLALRGVVDLRESLTALPHPRDGARLVDSGAYARVRHPIYGGIVAGATGYALLTASPLALLGAGLLLVFFRLKSGREEEWLRERYPAYEAYAARTRRMLPGIY